MAKTGLPASIYKELVEGLSAYQSAINTGVIPPTMTEEEWVLSLYGTDGAPGPPGTPGVVQSIVAGTGTTVDDTDPANPVISITGGGGGGGMTLLSMMTPDSYYSNGFGTVGNELICLRDVDLFGIECQLSNSASTGMQYKGVAIKKIDSTDVILEVHETDVYTLSSRDDFNSGKNITLLFPTPVSITREADLTNVWFIGVMRLDGGATAPTHIGKQSNSPSQQWQFFRHMFAGVIDDITPTVGEPFTTSNAGGHFPFILFAGLPSA